MMKLLVFDVGNTLIHQVDDKERALNEYHPLVLLPGARESIRALADHFRIVILSNTFNTTSAQMTRVCSELGIGVYVDRVFTSLSIGARKPHPAAFQTVLRYAAVRAAEAVMIGDSFEDDILGAAAVGMHSILLSAAEVGPRPPAAFVVTDLQQITATMISMIETQ